MGQADEPPAGLAGRRARRAQARPGTARFPAAGTAGRGPGVGGVDVARHRQPGPLRLGNSEFAPDRMLVMAIVNRTTDSFYRPGLTWDFTAALDHVAEVVEQGAHPAARRDNGDRLAGTAVRVAQGLRRRDAWPAA